MKEPRFEITLNLTYNAYLGLLWDIDGTVPGGCDKGVITQIAKYDKRIARAYTAWKKANFKCAGKDRKGRESV